jgi:hypothetical protein
VNFGEGAIRKVEAIISSENLALSKLHGSITQNLVSVKENKYLPALRTNSALKMVAIYFFETLLKIRQTTHVTFKKTVISKGTMNE